ncbi:MAG TPA: phosphate ABC transporter permease PstA [Acidobacteriota bacterium]|nr:phosphate ABC transporter permease PstA [Acidobacteriota bacterium]
MTIKDLSRTRAAGESFVWFTSMGLAIGLCMVAFLIALIIVNGVVVFWPARVVQVQLKENSAARINNAPYFAGTVVKEQAKAAAAVTGGGRMESQFFVGNKDQYGFTFKFVDSGDIVRTEEPPDILMVERMEYGNAIGFAKSLEVKGQTALPATDPQFQGRLEQLVEEAAARRAEIRTTEKFKIGAINHEMEELHVREKMLQKSGTQGPALTAALSEIHSRVDSLQADYELLASRARDLRDKQEQDVFVYRIPTGEEVRVPTGRIVSFYYPNRLNLTQRLGLFFHRLWGFVSEEPREANTEGGIFPAIFGTFVMTLLLSVAVTPFGVLAAIYLREYARQGLFVRSVRIAVNNLAGVPSIVFGVFGLGFFVYFVGGTIDRLFFSQYLPTPTFGTGGILWAALTLALMTVPVVIVATEESLAAVPRGVREGSLACGASKWQTILRVVLPASAPGILTGLILAMARGAGEVAPLMLVGVVKLAPSLPIDGIYPYFHLDQKFMHLGFHIYDLGFQSPDSEAAKPMVFATTFFLILLVVLLNLGAIVIRERLRRKYSTGAF